MPLKVPNYRAVSELFSNKTNKTPEATNRAQPSPPSPPSPPSSTTPTPPQSDPRTIFGRNARPRDYVVPLPTQPPPQKTFLDRWRNRSTQSSTIPLSAPLSDPRLQHLTGDSITRRYAISQALGHSKANDLINKSTAYRKANPKLFKGVYDGGNIDRPIKVTKNDGFGASSGEYWPGSYDKATNTVSPERIEVRSDNPFATLIHELFHLDTSGSRPQDLQPVYRDVQRGKRFRPFVRYMYNKYRPVGSRTGKDAKVITDRSYDSDGNNKDRSEIGSQLGTLRIHLEQQGVDTSNKEELKKALSTMGDNPALIHNFEAQRIHRALNDPALSPEQRERGLDALVELMPGIAKADTSQYPYRKIASESSSSLRGLVIMSTISSLLKNR